MTVTHGKSVSFWETDTLSKLKEITVPTIVASASLHPEKNVFVCGGEDFKMYKYDYVTGNEIGINNKYIISLQKFCYLFIPYLLLFRIIQRTLWSRTRC